MTIDERLDRFKSYFLTLSNKMEQQSLDSLQEYLRPMDAENFDCIYNTLDEEERGLIDGDVTGDYDEMVKYLVYNKALHRYWDAVSGRTSYDNDEQKLVITPESSALELGISLNTFLRLRALKIYSIKQLYQVLEKNIPIFDGDMLTEVQSNLNWLMAQEDVKLEGWDGLQNI